MWFWNTIVRKYNQSLKLFSPGLSESETIDDITSVVHFRFVEPTKINSFPLSGPAGSLVCQWAVTIAVQGESDQSIAADKRKTCWQPRGQVRTQIRTSVGCPETRSKAIFKTQGTLRGRPRGGAPRLGFIVQVPKGPSLLQSISPGETICSHSLC